jgi:hypothetical protein
MRAKIPIIVSVVAVLAGAVWLFTRDGGETVGGNGAAKAEATAPPNGASREAGRAPGKAAPAKREAGVAIGEVFDVLKGGADSARAKAMLDSLARELRAMPVGEAAVAVRGFLATRRDAGTGAAFAIGEGGNLATAPTFRVWLLDQLGQISPEAGADFAVEILAARESADEWAVAMRNFARVRGAAGDVAFINGKMRELLGEPRWRAEQSVGWLEAFDVAVHTRATALTPDLAGLLTRTEKQDKPAAYAAFLTLDRLVQAAPVEMLTRPQADPELMRGRELTRANYFSRADVRDAEQRAIMESYLLDPNRSAEELAKFAGLYPNAIMMISKNLLTPTATPSQDELIARDREALRVAANWARDSRFSAIKPHVGAILARLSDFVRQAGR